MDCEKEISARIETIKTIFQKAKDLSAMQKNITLLIEEFEQTDPEFRSIAYEGASMGIALMDFEKDKTLSNWHTFNEKASQHAAQTHAGLGWAIAQQNCPALPILEILPPLLRFRVIDGCGYYDGIFRQRTSIKAQKVPEEYQNYMLQAYDQGIGRSLWYACKGDVTKVQEMVLSFSPERHQAIWVGIGVACAYVGGCDETLLKSLLVSSNQYKTQLAVGATLASRARVQANAMTKDVEAACRIWCNLSSEDAMLLSIKAEPHSLINPNDSYALWLSQMAMALMISKDNK